jgi:hypothetical protein
MILPPTSRLVPALSYLWPTFQYVSMNVCEKYVKGKERMSKT